MANNPNDRNQQNVSGQNKDTSKQGMGRDSGTQRQEGQSKSGSDRSMQNQQRDQQNQNRPTQSPPKSGSDR